MVNGYKLIVLYVPKANRSSVFLADSWDPAKVYQKCFSQLQTSKLKLLQFPLLKLPKFSQYFRETLKMGCYSLAKMDGVCRMLTDIHQQYIRKHYKSKKPGECRIFYIIYFKGVYQLRNTMNSFFLTLKHVA